ncbi:hypothetical protein [Micromonospora sp. IBSANI012]|uniref:hypothetical protein n=1 Tax=Micromonospora sp. IBSANI012 TaxID=3457761 RepID=UPI004058152E
METAPVTVAAVASRTEAELAVGLLRSGPGRGRRPVPGQLGEVLAEPVDHEPG